MTLLQPFTVPAAAYRASSTLSVSTRSFWRTLNKSARSRRRSSMPSPPTSIWIRNRSWSRRVTVDTRQTPSFQRGSTQEGKRDEQDLRSVAPGGTGAGQEPQPTPSWSRNRPRVDPGGGERTLAVALADTRLGDVLADSKVAFAPAAGAPANASELDLGKIGHYAWHPLLQQIGRESC